MKHWMHLPLQLGLGKSVVYMAHTTNEPSSRILEVLLHPPREPAAVRLGSSCSIESIKEASSISFILKHKEWRRFEICAGLHTLEVLYGLPASVTRG